MSICEGPCFECAFAGVCLPSVLMSVYIRIYPCYLVHVRVQHVFVRSFVIESARAHECVVRQILPSPLPQHKMSLSYSLPPSHFTKKKEKKNKFWLVNSDSPDVPASSSMICLRGKTSTLIIVPSHPSLPFIFFCLLLSLILFSSTAFCNIFGTAFVSARGLRWFKRKASF